MIMGIYKRANPKGVWYLVSHTSSAEIAKQDKITTLEKAIKEGKKEAEVGVMVFDTVWGMPETLREIKEDERLLYN
jgi:hypothetical protein